VPSAITPVPVRQVAHSTAAACGLSNFRPLLAPPGCVSTAPSIAPPPSQLLGYLPVHFPPHSSSPILRDLRTRVFALSTDPDERRRMEEQNATAMAQLGSKDAEVLASHRDRYGWGEGAGTAEGECASWV
jgi:hypothetical protein